MRCSSMSALVALVVAGALALEGLSGAKLSFFMPVGVDIFCSPCFVFIRLDYL